MKTMMIAVVLGVSCFFGFAALHAHHSFETLPGWFGGLLFLVPILGAKAAAVLNRTPHCALRLCLFLSVALYGSFPSETEWFLTLATSAVTTITQSF